MFGVPPREIGCYAPADESVFFVDGDKGSSPLPRSISILSAPNDWPSLLASMSKKPAPQDKGNALMRSIVLALTE